MSLPQIGKLVEVELREAWPKEAYSLTPWLAANLSELSEVIGIPLELQATEVAVEQYAADILARNPLDESLVLIENQLEASDHRHLGQIMTYLAGLQARTIIWIARDFTEAHLSALRWLNDHTDESFAFFAVRLRAVRIGMSLPAPQFEICCRPNVWERRLHTIAEGAQSEAGQFREQFWTHFVQRHPEELQYAEPNGATSRWRTLRDIGLIVATYATQDHAGVFVRGLSGADPDEVFVRLETQRDLLEHASGVELGPHPQGRFLIKRRHSDNRNQAIWDELCDWLHRTNDEYEAILRQAFPPVT